MAEPMEVNIRIGVIGPVVLVEQIGETIKGFPSFEPLLLGYRDESEVPSLVHKAAEESEVLLFSDPWSFELAEEDLPSRIPSQYVPQTGSGLLRSLFRIKASCGLHALSVDTLTKSSVSKALTELGEDGVKITGYSGSASPTDVELTAFHLEAARANTENAALTGRASVYAALKKQGVSVDWVQPTEGDIIVSLERALLSTETRKSKESQIVVGYLHVDDFDRLAERKGTEHDVQRFMLDIHRLLLNYTETLEGHLTQLGRSEYMFTTTRGIFERETGGYKRLPLATKADKTYGLSLSVGIGFGRSASEAGTHAKLALRQAKDAGGNICFIVREDLGIIGPLEMSEPNELDLSLIDPAIVQEAAKVGLTIHYLSKLVANLTRFARTDYDAHQLSDVLGITVRSTHRLLVAWQDAGLVTVAGEKKNGAKGRPTQIYRIAFLSELVR